MIATVKPVGKTKTSAVKIPHHDAWFAQATAEGRVREMKYSVEKALKATNRTQARVALEPANVDALAAILDYQTDLAPVLVIEDAKTGEPYLADGFHRLSAYVRADRKTIPARVVSGTFEEALQFACSCNRQHCLVRNAADVRKAVSLLLMQPEWFERSDSWVGDIVGCSTAVVCRVRRMLVESNQIQALTHVMDRNGRKIPASRLPAAPRIVEHKTRTGRAFYVQTVGQAQKSFPTRREAEIYAARIYDRRDFGAGSKPQLQKNSSNGRLQYTCSIGGKRVFLGSVPASASESVRERREQLAESKLAALWAETQANTKVAVNRRQATIEREKSVDMIAAAVALADHVAAMTSRDRAALRALVPQKILSRFMTAYGVGAKAKSR